MLPKAIILIGPDKGGKSTLTTSLKEEYEYFRRIKCVKPIDVVKQTEDIMRTISNSLYPTILDRFYYPDDLIYNDFNANKEIPPGIIKWYNLYVVDMLKRIGTLFIYCYADIPILVQRFNESGETDIKVDWLKAIKERYDNWIYSNLFFKPLSLDSGRLSKEKMFSFAKAGIEQLFGHSYN